MIVVGDEERGLAGLGKQEVAFVLGCDIRKPIDVGLSMPPAAALTENEERVDAAVVYQPTGRAVPAGDLVGAEHRNADFAHRCAPGLVLSGRVRREKGGRARAVKSLDLDLWRLNHSCSAFFTFPLFGIMR